jgi:DNA-directed RNA polymerase specialized sigma subunit
MSDILLLVKRAKNGDKDALERIVQNYTPLIEKYCKDLQSEVKEDCRQYLVTNMISAVKRFKPVESYLYK